MQHRTILASVFVPRSSDSLRFRIFRWNQKNRSLLVHIRISLLELMGDGLHLRLRRGNRNARFHSPDKAQEKCAAILKPFVTGRPNPSMHCERHPNFRRHADIDASKPRWRHADNAESATV